MKKKNLFLKSLLIMAICFGITGCAIGRDDKDNEIVEDPLKTKSEYYIVGMVKNSNGGIKNATVAISEDLKVTTDARGVYSLTVNEAKSYKLTFTADGHEPLETTTNVAAVNRGLTTVNAKLAKTLVFGPLYTGDGATIEVPRLESPKEEIAGTITIPAGGTEPTTKIASVAFEEPSVANPANSMQPEEVKASNNNFAIKASPADAIATKDIKILVPNPSEQADQGYFNTDDIVVESTELPMTRAALKKVDFVNNNYVIVIPKGEKIAGKYYLRVKFTRQADKIVTDGYNTVNDKNGVYKLENRDYSALNNVSLKLKVKSGWDYVTSPKEALKEVGASEALAAEINKFIENAEGGLNGSYDIEKELITNISGNHVLYYGSKSMSRIKTYAFNIIVGGQKRSVVVKLKAYTGHKEEYTNAPISQHSGGGTGSQN